jgi:hypothetical protein
MTTKNNMNAKMEPRLNGASSGTNHNDATDVEAFVFSPQPPALSPEKAMAGSVLRQAAYDLRRFRGATGGVERQLYLDAYDWITADDFSWPYSFVNICQSLNLAPEVARRELLEDASSGIFRFWTKRAGRVLRAVQTFVTHNLGKYPNSNRSDSGPLVSVLQ